MNYLKPFETPHFKGVWFPFSGDRLALRTEIQTHLQGAIQDPSGTLQVTDQGPRWIGQGPLHLSYSHTEGAAILIFSQDQELGVDVESQARTFRDSPLKIAERYFHETEVKLLRSLDSNPVEMRAQFLELWLKKEAYGKLTRKGLQDSIHQEVSTLPGISFEVIPVTPTGFRAYSARAIQPSSIRA